MRINMDCTALVPLDDGVLVVRASSGLMVDIADSALPYHVGGHMASRVSTYGCMVADMASPYIHRVYRNAPTSAIKVTS